MSPSCAPVYFIIRIRPLAGGAEQLIVNAALALQQKGHEITIYTAHHDRGHCFQETKDGGTRIVDNPHLVLNIHAQVPSRSVFMHMVTGCRSTFFTNAMHSVQSCECSTLL